MSLPMYVTKIVVRWLIALENYSPAWHATALQSSLIYIKAKAQNPCHIVVVRGFFLITD